MKKIEVIKKIKGDEATVFREQLAINHKILVEKRNPGTFVVPEGLAAAADKLVNAIATGRNVFLCGGVGTGKTTIAQACAIVSAFFFKHDRGMKMHIIDAVRCVNYEHELMNARAVIIDDLGCEPEIHKVFGTPKHVMSDAINWRYNSERFTMITTNLSPAQIKYRYGERVADRMAESYEVVHLNWASLRRLKK